MISSKPDLTLRQQDAAQHVAEDRLTDEAIAKLAGISRQTLHAWKRRPLFAHRVEAIRERAAAVLDEERAGEHDVPTTMQPVPSPSRTVEIQPPGPAQCTTRTDERIRDFLVSNGELPPDP